MGARSRGCQITGIQFDFFRNWITVIGYPRDLQINYALFDSFPRTVSYSFQNLLKALQAFSLKKRSQKTFLIPKFIIDIIN